MHPSTYIMNFKFSNINHLFYIFFMEINISGAWYGWDFCFNACKKFVAFGSVLMDELLCLSGFQNSAG